MIAFATIGVFPNAAKADEFPPLFPFLISYDGPDNASSVAHWLDAPAGKHGFVRCENGHFVNAAGRVWLHATNLTGPANFPTHDAADKLSARLARFGINCVRLHYMDAKYGNFRQPPKLGIIAEDPATQRNLDVSQLDRLDYMIAAFKKRGIYVDMNLHVARTLDARDGLGDKTNQSGFNRGVDSFMPRIIELQKEYAKKLLTHVNPYTGLAYTDDPCVAVVELNNENALFQVYHSGELNRLREPYATEFRKQWNAWLRKKYSSTATMLEAWKLVPTPLADEQIPEGRFTEPVAIDGRKWTFATGRGDATCTVADGVLRVTVNREGEELFPKLFRKLSLKKDHVYTLSFKIRRPSGVQGLPLGLAVADTKGSWRSMGVHQQISFGSTWKSYSFSFLAADDSDRAQFQLARFKTGTYELDDVSFQSGAKTDFDDKSRIEDDTVPTFKTTGYAPMQAVRDFYEFLVDTERNYWTGLYGYLKRELKVKSVVSGTQLGYSPPQVQADLDYIDIHSYWCHPADVGPNWRINNQPMVNSLACIKDIAAQRVLGKPYTVSEYNHPFPNQFGAEGQPMLRAYGRLQGWDGVFEYTYNHEPDFEPTHNTYFFSMIARTDVLAHMPACAAMYLRGDVHEARDSVVGAVDYQAYFDRLVRTKSIGTGIASAGLDSRLALLHKTAVDLSGKVGTDPATVEKIPANQKVLTSDTGELTWNVEEPEAGYWTVNTANTKLFTGFPKGRTISLGGVTLAIGKTRLDWATVSLVSRNATGFGESNRPASILLAATGMSENKGMALERLSDHTFNMHNWGDGPTCVEGIPATVILPSDAARVKCYALEPSGNRKREVPVEKADGGSKIVLKPEYETVWYELDVK